MLNDAFKKDYELVKASWYYYSEGLTQQEIADKLKISRLKVSKMIEEAKRKKLIQFVVPIHYRERLELEEALCNRYDLDDVFLVPCANDHNTNEILGKGAAIYLNSLIQDDVFLNFGYGETLNHLLSYLSVISENHLSIVSLTGGVAMYLPKVNAINANTVLNLIPAPLVLKSKQTVDIFLKEQSVLDIINLTKLAKYSVVGIGELSTESTIIKQGILSKYDIMGLKGQGAVADILMHFIDQDGNLITSEMEQRIISTPLKNLKNIENVIAVAGGLKKIEAIKAALRTNLFSRLITTIPTAEKLLL